MLSRDLVRALDCHSPLPVLNTTPFKMLVRDIGVASAPQAPLHESATVAQLIYLNFSHFVLVQDQPSLHRVGHRNCICSAVQLQMRRITP